MTDPTEPETEFVPKIQMSPVGRLERIILATDGSEHAESAEEIAFDICEKTGAPLFMVRAIPSPTWHFLVPGGSLSMSEEAEQYLKDRMESAEGRGITVNIAVPDADDPADAIVREAKRAQADLIIKGRRGAREPTRLLVGDSTARVIGQAPCPVLVVPPHGEKWKEILVAIDGSRFSDAATVMAATMARHFARSVTVLSVKVPSHSQRRQNEADPIIARALEYFKQEGIDAVGRVESGLVDDVVIEAASQGNSLVVLGAFGRTGFGRALLGSKTERIVNQATWPVLVVGSRG
ncbi:MAG: universal stress protein [Pseudomonadota bacterium]